jgi:hypothetical protein
MQIKRGFMLEPNLVLYLPLYEVDGASFMSRDAYGHLCAVTGALWKFPGRYFDGVDDNISISDHAALKLTSDITIIGWINPAGWGEGGWGRLVSKMAGFEIYLGNGLFAAVFSGVSGNDFYSPANVLSLNIWQFVAVTRIKTTGIVAFYLNGIQLSATGGGTQAMTTSTNALYIGNRAAGDRTFNGLIGEVGIHSRALTPQEIQHNYLGTKWRYQ